MPDNDHQFREALIRSLHTKPLLVETEKALHSQADVEMSARLRSDMERTLSAPPIFKDQDRGVFQPFEPDIIRQFRNLLKRSLTIEPTLAEGEEDLLMDLGFEKLGEFRSTVQAQLETPAAIPEENLAIYIPSPEAGGNLIEGIKKAIDEVQIAGDPGELDIDEVDLNASVSELLGVLESQSEDVPRFAEDEIVPARGLDVAELPAAETRGLELEEAQEVQSALIASAPLADGIPSQVQPEGLTPLTFLTAALETVGVKQDGFGFLLRYGRYASDGRESEFLVGGLGMAELSKRLSVWLETRKAENCQVQVVDDGSGELALYLTSQEIEQ